MIIGPISKPIGPKNTKPPKTDKSIKKGCTCEFRPISFGASTLSIRPTIITPHIRSPIAAGVCPIIKRYMTAGAIIIAVPMLGMSDARMAILPNSMAFGIPNIVNPIVASIP